MDPTIHQPLLPCTVEHLDQSKFGKLEQVNFFFYAMCLHVHVEIIGNVFPMHPEWAYFKTAYKKYTRAFD
jgi:hypothetical protein